MINRSVTHPVSRFRSRDFRLLVVIRRIASYGLVGDVRVSVRWIPNEYNPSSIYSRVPKDDELKNCGLTSKFDVMELQPHAFEFGRDVSRRCILIRIKPS